MIPAALTRAPQPARRALNARHARTRTGGRNPSVHAPTGGMYIETDQTVEPSETALKANEPMYIRKSGCTLGDIQ